MLIACITLLLVSNLYVFSIAISNKPVENISVNETPTATQINNINGSSGFSINGDVTNVGRTEHIVVVKTQDPVTVEHNNSPMFIKAI
jgi:hypothetical protein